ncbi:MAG: extracellular solute-binding protein [Candidatus Cohnella colombiensis]|uniref:Extracellular solute-binding protein n=1 Tax=Candidatus Cohnella colombiensis TaxID=3121368 RepID=A0AA95JAT4_9BACL|nr:MAG: extracellular solute-binding protein [Cohnella sp.]
MHNISKRMFTAVVLIIMVSMLVAGCGSNNNTSTNGSASANNAGSSETPSTVDSKKDPVTLKFTYWGSPYEKAAMEAAVANFEKKYDYIKVNAQHIPADYETKLTAMVAGNEAPDIGYVRDFMALPLAEEGKLHNIFDFIDQDPELNKEDFLEQAFIYWAPEKSFGMYTAMESYGMFYNKELFKEAGVAELPTTADKALNWDQLIEIAKKLTLDKKGRNANDPNFDHNQIRQYGINFAANFVGYMPLVSSAGGDYISEDGQSFGLTQPESIDMIQKMSDLINVHHVAPSPAESKSIPAAAASIQSKQVAILMTGQWVLLDLGKSGVDFGIGIMPKIKYQVSSPGFGVASIFQSSKHPEEAYLFWKWLANPETSMDLHANGLWMPLMKKYYTDPEFIAKWADVKPAHPDGYKEAIMETGLNNFKKHPSAYVKNFVRIDSIVQPAIERTYFGKTTAEDAMKSIEQEVNALIQGRYDK